jgi:hypothetical protein
VREAVVDGRDRECGGFDHGARVVGGRWAAGQLCRDDRPRGIRVATRELEAAQARAGTGFDERTDPHAGVVEHDGEVRHVASEPPQVTRGSHDPVGGDDGDRDGVEHGCRVVGSAVVGGRVGDIAREVDHVMTQDREVGGDPFAQLARRVDRDRVAPSGSRRAGARPLLTPGCRLERRLEPREQLVHSLRGPAESDADGGERADARAMPKRRDQPRLEVARIAQHDARLGRAELEVGG